MHYAQMVPGVFCARPNRFIALVEICGKQEICHVKNTGRCKELLIVGAEVWCQVAQNPKRKTKYDLIAVRKGQRLINMDSQAPNTVAKQWLLDGGLGPITDLRSEVTYGDSRFDFAFCRKDKQCYLEVKGVTLEKDGVCAFPDAPTLRGTKHLRGLQNAVDAGCEGYVLFVIQMQDVSYLHPNDAADPVFAEALREAVAHGVTALAMDCQVSHDTITIRRPVPIRLENAL